MALPGPGVTLVTMAKIAKAVSVSIDIGVAGTLPRRRPRAGVAMRVRDGR
jgi:hypothetical protein